LAKFNADHKAIIDSLLLDHPLIRPGKMFGYPAYYVSKKLCICLYEEGVGVKLPAATVTNLLESDPNAIPFQPLGKPKMREWVQINCDASKDYAAYQSVFEESIQHVAAQKEKAK
jgi:hypothetical protein